MFALGRKPVTQLDFLVIGAQKAGTTALNYYLRRHPRIALPEKKELHFFDDDERFTRGAPDYEVLHRRFAPARPGAIAGENTPNYLYWATAMPRTYAYNPAIKLVCILRNPIERAFSQWNMQRARGIEPLDFIDALRAEPERLVQLPSGEKRKFAYLDRGRYAAQLKRVFSLFPREQVLVLNYARFRSEQRKTVEQIYTFLGLALPRSFKSLEAHSIPYPRKLQPEERKLAREILDQDIRELEQLLGWDCESWR